MSNIVATKEGPISIFTINRPEKRNALDFDSADLLREHFEAFEADPDAKIAILTGSSTVFCAGFDLKVAAQDTSRYEPEGNGPIGPSRMLTTKPVIAAVEGYAVAGGFELALWADLRVVSETAVFGVFCRRWGVPLIDGGTIRLPRLIGHSRALDLILTGRPCNAEEAYHIGLANRLVPAGEALEHARKLAQDIIRFPQDTVRIDRMSSYVQWGMPIEDALLNEGRKANASIMTTAQNGAARFASGLGRGGNFDKI